MTWREARTGRAKPASGAAQRFPDIRGRTTLGSDDAALAEGVVEELEVGLLEEALGGALRIGRVGNDHVKGVLVVVEELEAVADVDGGLGVVEANGHAGEVLLREADDGLRDVQVLALYAIAKARSRETVPRQCRRGWPPRRSRASRPHGARRRLRRR